MDEAQVLAIVRDFLEKKRLVKTAAALLQELQALEPNSNSLSKNATSTPMPTALGLLSQELGKLSVVAEVEDEDQFGSSSATSSPQCTSSELIASNTTSEFVTNAIPITKLKGKSDADKPLQGPRRANSYQPPSTLAQFALPVDAGDAKNKPVVTDYVRPKRVSTSTGHQRPAAPDSISLVPLHMAQSGLIPVPEMVSPHTPPTPPSTSASAPIRVGMPPSAIPETVAARSTPGTSSLGTNRSRRSRTSSISEEARHSSLTLGHTSSLDTYMAGSHSAHGNHLHQQHAIDLQELMTSPKLASPPPSSWGHPTTSDSKSSTPSAPSSNPVSSHPSDSPTSPAPATTAIISSQISLASDPQANKTKSPHAASKQDASASPREAITTPQSDSKASNFTISTPAPEPTITPQVPSGFAEIVTSTTTGVPSTKGTISGVSITSLTTTSTVSHQFDTDSGSVTSMSELASMTTDDENDMDEYSDDDDLGYVRISSIGMTNKHLLHHYAVFGLDDSSSSESDDDLDMTDDEMDDDQKQKRSGSATVVSGLRTKRNGGLDLSDTSDESSEEDYGDDDEEEAGTEDADDDESGSDDGDILRASKGIGKSKKPKSKQTAKKSSGATVSSHRQHSMSSGNGPAANTGTMFHMEGVSDQKKKSKKWPAPSRWLARPLPPGGPIPALKMPEQPVANSSAATTSLSGPVDLSVVNVKKARAKDITLEYFNMKIVYDRQKTGFEATHDFPIRIADVIAGRYEIVEYLGSAAFSRAVKCIDHLKGTTVCLKIIKNNKDYFDQSLDEIKLLTLIKAACQERCDDFHVLELYDYFYFKEHLFLVCELLRENLYEVYKYNRQSGETLYFNIPRLQRVAWQCLTALNFIHSRNLIHCDLKPENILIKSYSRSLVKVIDFGSSCFTSDQLSSYVQSRSYRAPEVVLGYPYDQRIDMWSLGCILAELWTGRVLFQNESLATLIAKHIGILGLQKSDRQYLKEAPLADDIFTAEGVVYEKKQASNSTQTQTTDFIQIKRTTLRKRLQTSDPLFLSFVSSLLRINPAERPTSWEAMHHPWFRQVYPEP